MDFEFTDEQKALYKEWDTFYSDLMKDKPKIMRGGYGTDRETVYGEGFEKASFPWQRKVNEAENARGYLNISWPVEYGGKGLGPVEQLMLAEIKNYHRVPAGNWAGIKLLAPSLMMYGTEEQKKFFLPRVLNWETFFCQAWSEPNAGSDLASLTTRAVRDGDFYVLNGQKTWVSGAQSANWGHAPIRTNPDASLRHKGLSYFMFPLDTPGITVRPIISATHREQWGEIFFEDARIPAKYMVGEENKGWYVTMATANYERSNRPFAEIKRDVEELVAFCVNTKRSGKRLIDDPYIREELAELVVEGDRLRALCYRAAWNQSKKLDVTMYASGGKILWTELVHKTNNFIAHRIGGLYGALRVGSEWAQMDGIFESLWEIDLGMVINVGHNDIQHNVIAGWGLKMPKD